MAPHPMIDAKGDGSHSNKLGPPDKSSIYSLASVRHWKVVNATVVR